MRTRPTPFGLFAGVSRGTFAESTRLRFGDRARARVSVRLDMGLVHGLSTLLQTRAAIRSTLSYWPNTSLKRRGLRLSYAESRLRGSSISHELSEVVADDFVEAAVAVAREGASFDELVGSVVAADPDGEVTPEEARSYIEELIDSEVLVGSLQPTLTDGRPLCGLILALERAALQDPDLQGLARQLRDLRDAVERADGSSLEDLGDRLTALEDLAAKLPVESEPGRRIQVDLFFPNDEVALGPLVEEELKGAIHALRHLTRWPVDDGLSGFRRGFRERYGEGQRVPLNEALDEETGIDPFATLPSPTVTPQATWAAVDSLLLARLERVLREGRRELEITDKDLRSLQTTPVSLPKSLSVVASIAAASEEDVDRGRFRLFVRGAAGPSGARVLGRFCHGDPELARLVRDQLEREEELEEGAILAEVMHLPEGRLGNVLLRPALRRHEIWYLGSGDATGEHRLTIEDLEVALLGDEIVLYRAGSEQRVIPRLTSAHTYTGPQNLPIYRFLCTLQNQGLAGGFVFHWGVLDTMEHLPRVTFGRSVLKRERWRIGARDLERWRGAREESFREVERTRQRLELPRNVLLVEGDNELFVDLEDRDSVDGMVGVVKQRPSIVLEEFFPGPEELCARGPDGAYCHEIVVPFEAVAPQRSSSPPASRSRPRSADDIAAASRLARCAPGSQWAFAKIYTGPAVAERILLEELDPCLQDLRRSGEIDGWFFMRYGDPEWHLRVRMRCSDPSRRAVATGLFENALDRALRDREVWCFEWSTYQREIERYGGVEAMEVAEELFEADSVAVCELLRLLDGASGDEEKNDLRWRMAFLGSLSLIRDLGLSVDEQSEVWKRLFDAFAREFGPGKQLKRRLATRFRALRADLESDFESGPPRGSVLEAARFVLDRRGGHLHDLGVRLHSLDQAGELDQPLHQVCCSLVHMFNNRLFKTNSRLAEREIYEYVHRLQRSVEAKRSAVRQRREELDSDRRKVATA